MKYAMIVTMGTLEVLAGLDTDVDSYLVRYLTGRSRDRLQTIFEPFKEFNPTRFVMLACNTE
jgi:hypothetical protein